MPAYGFEITVDDLRLELADLTERLEMLRTQLAENVADARLQAEHDSLVDDIDGKLRRFRAILQSDLNVSHGA